MFRAIITGVLAAAAVLAAASPADAALTAYLKLKSQKQGEIKGGVTQKGREGRIAVIEASVQMSVPVDSATHLPTGKLQAGELVIRKELDKSTPLLYAAMAGNEVFTEFELQHWTPQLKAATGVGSEVQHYTIKLSNARIIRHQFVMLNVRNPDLVKFAEYEEIAFSYEKLTVTWNDGGITAEVAGNGSPAYTPPPAVIAKPRKKAANPAPAAPPLAVVPRRQPAAPVRRAQPVKLAAGRG